MSLSWAVLCGHAVYGLNIFVSLTLLIAGTQDPMKAAQKGLWGSELWGSSPLWLRCNDEETRGMVAGLVVQLLTSRQTRKQRARVGSRVWL